jgi:peptidyl-prolyl cis-trans isomerase SurA
MVAKAEIDSVVVEEEMVDRQLDMRMQNVVAQAGGDPDKLEEAFGKVNGRNSREDLRDQVKEQMLVERYAIDHNGRYITVTPAEVKRFFKNIPSLIVLPYFSTEVEIAQIVKKPEISAEERDRIRRYSLDVRQEALDGTDFQVLGRKTFRWTYRTKRWESW